MIAPGRYADILLVEDLAEFKACLVIAQGKVVAQDYQMTIELPEFDYPEWVTHSVHLGKTLVAADFCLAAPHKAKVTANIIGVVEKQAPTRHLQLEVPVINGEIKVDMDRDIAKLALVERHKATGGVQVGLVQGFGFQRGVRDCIYGCPRQPPYDRGRHR